MGNRRRLKINNFSSLNGFAVLDNDDRPGAAAVAKFDYPGPGAINAYVCSTCYKLTIVQHVDKGVTPMYMACQVTEGCDGTGRSMRYPVDPPQKVIDAVGFEWYRPSHREFVNLSPEMKIHVERGGLVLRRKKK